VSQSTIVGKAAQGIGGLAGAVDGTGSIQNVVALGTVSATAAAQYVGGLVGSIALTSGTSITGATSSAQVNVTGAVNRVGGLVGTASTGPIITNATASGAVAASGASHVGGLIGWNEATVTLSSATGTVTGLSNVGGAFGTQRGNVSRTWASGNVTGGGTKVGGFAGAMDTATAVASRCSAQGAVSNDVSGATGTVGGFVGDAISANISDSYASGNVTARSTGTANGGFAGHVELGTLARNYCRGSITNGVAASKGAFIGTVTGTTAPSLTSLFYSTATTTGLTDIGTSISALGTNPTSITGVTDAALKTQSTFTGWNFTSTWSIATGNYPVLR
jgi:hypothetical protein